MTADEPPPNRTVRGHVWYRERMALPPDAQVKIEVLDASGPQGPLILAQASFGTEGRQVPIPFQVEVGAPEGQPRLLRASIIIDGRLAWLSELVPLPKDDSADAGDVLLRRVVGSRP